jgi:predicted TIM-barrel fold metal-dependent hydrolase
MPEQTGRPYTLISCDAHAGADLLDYRPYLAKELHDDFDAWVATYQEDAWAKIDTEMVDTDDPYLKAGVASFLSPYNWDSDKRLAHMDEEGIAAEVIFPNTVPPFYPRGIISAPAPTNAEEYRYRWAGIQAHNRWLADFCALAPARRGGLAQVFLDDIDDAVREVHWAREAGLLGMLIPADHSQKLVNLYERRLDPFWAACAETRMPVTRHTIFVGPPETPESGPATDGIGMLEVMPFFRRGLPHLLMGGVFERFPELKVVFTETFSNWVPEDLMILDRTWQMAFVRGTAPYANVRRAAVELKKPPSEYFKTNVWIGISVATRREVSARQTVGVDRLLWGSDYPHHEGSWPRTKLAMRWMFSDVPEDEVRAMTSENTAQVYGFDLERLQTIADKIGPTPDELQRPVTAEELPDMAMCPAIGEAIATFDPSKFQPQLN